MHENEHPLKDKVVPLNGNAEDPIRNIVVANAEFHVIDWWDRLSKKPWYECDNNIAVCNYAYRAGLTGLPPDTEVVYGHIDGLGHLVHASELGEVADG